MYASTFILYVLSNTIFWHVVVDARAVLPSHIHPSKVKHFAPELDTNIGYWSPSTSSIDWCERNYVVTQYIAEFWNCLSSFSMCILGGILFIRGLYHKIETRFLLSSLGFAVVGLGSAYFHGTLTHLGQMADELPMVYSMIIWWFLLIRLNEFKQIKNKIFSIDMLILFGIFYALLWTYVHSLQAFVLIFQIHISLIVVGGIIKLISLYQQPHHHVHRIKYMLIVYVGLIILAFICWTMDQQMGVQFNTISRFNPQLHAWWHIIGAVHCHLGIVCAEAMRLLSLKYQQHQENSLQSARQPFKPEDNLHIIFYLGVPYVDYSKEKRTNEAKVQ
ncbi:unnamed protein product [Rotaria sp. Silwood1]|nr:unnamed protein product [Rotaria sp. Silwood1]CAF1618505.1 unnamed protein product [Rotaria sp. Silwood1]CAF3846293.1 unnamed protein product [Rotaria sp. Silwood1]